MNLTAKWRSWAPQYKTNLTLAFPVVLSQVGQVIVQLVDNAMVGQLGAAPLAAVSFGGAIFMIFLLWGTGLSLGQTPLVGEAYARGNTRQMVHYFQNSLLLNGLLGVGLLVVLLSIGQFMGHMGQNDETVELARPYYTYLSWSIVPFMIYAAFKQFLEGVGNTKVAMSVILIANCVNILFNYLLIYGKWGFPAMGAGGAGLSTLISRILMLVMLITYFFYKKRWRNYFRLFSWVEQSWRWIKELWRVGFPISMQMLMEMLAFSLSAIMMGWIGTVQQAAHQITVSMASFAFMMLLGVSAATTICVSHEFGKGNLRQLNRSAMASFHLGIFFNLITAILFIVFRHQLPYLFTSDPAVAETAATFFIMAAIFQISDGMQVIALGILRGMQDVKITMWYALLSYLVVNLPIGYLMAFVLGLGGIGLWIGFIVGLTLAAGLYFRRYRKLYLRLRRAKIGLV